MFINRTEEINLLQSDFECINEGSRFIVLYAPTGYGKSELVNKAFNEYDYFIRVKVAKHECSKNIPCLHIKELGRSLNYFAMGKKTIPTLEQFFKNTEKSISTISKKIFAEFIEKNKFIPSSELGHIVRQKKGSESEDITDAVFTSDHSDAYTIICKYIKHILNKFYVIVTIENIQNIDSESLVFFQELLVTNRVYILGEYTESEDTQIDKYHLYNYFKNDYIKSTIIEIKKMPLMEIIKECYNKPDVIKAILEDSYNKSSGNLHNL